MISNEGVDGKGKYNINRGKGKKGILKSKRKHCWKLWKSCTTRACGDYSSSFVCAKKFGHKENQNLVVILQRGSKGWNMENNCPVINMKGFRCEEGTRTDLL